MPLADAPTMEEITERMSKIEHKPDRVMTPEEMLDMADKIENNNFHGHIDYLMSREETIKALRKRAYEILDNN